MKRVQLLLSALFIAYGITSQAQVITSPTADEHRNMVLKAVKRASAKLTAGKTTGIQQRLKAYANHAVSPVPGFIDSAGFFYSGTKGSSYNKNEMDFLTEGFDPTFEPMVDMTPYMYRSDMMENEFDSTVLFAFDTLSQSVQPMTTVSVAYHAPKFPSVITGTDHSSGAPVKQKMMCAYDNGGKMLSAKMVVEMMGSWDTMFARYFVYDANGKISHDSSVMNYMGTNMNFMKYDYEYEAGTGKLVTIRSWMGFTGTWEETSRILLAWNGQNRIKVVTTIQWDGTAYQPVGQDSLGYNSTGDIITYRLYKEPGMNMQLENKWYQAIKLNAQGLPDTALVYANTNGVWELESKATVSYNSYGNPVWKNMDSYVAGTLTESYAKHYYYEEYNDNPTNVDDQNGGNAIVVYPNPATESIAVKWKEASDIKAGVNIYNMTGQQIAAQPMQLTGETNVNIQSYPAGQYLLIIKDDKGVLINRQSFIKM